MKYIIRASLLFGLVGAVWMSSAMLVHETSFTKRLLDSVLQLALADTTELPMPHAKEELNPSEKLEGVSLPLPDNIKYDVEFDPISGEYVIVQKIGEDIDFRSPTSMTLDEYLDFEISENLAEFWNKKREEEDAEERAFAPTLKVGGKGFENIFGSNQIEIRPQGSAELSFGVNISKTENPRIPENQRRISTFDFNQRIQLNVVGNIGTKMKLTTNYNTEATFDFENQMKLEYTGDEDEIIKKIEAGNVSMSLPGTLISGNQSLFGVKMETQWGRLKNTTVFSQQKGEKKEIDVQGGAQTQSFEFKADNYEANKHYFLSNYFHEVYDDALSSLPIVKSDVNITRIEVWVVNTQANTQDVRNILGFADLGENRKYISEEIRDNVFNMTDSIDARPLHPSNKRNDIYQDMTTDPEVLGFVNANQAIAAKGLGYVQGLHYERVGNARKLNASEYSYNAKLGFISLRQSLNNAEVLAVSYEYTMGGETYQVGSLSQDGFEAPKALVLKLLKSSITNVHSPIWDLMMKNVYNLGSFGINKDNFRLDLWYNNPSTGVDMNYIPRPPLEGELLLQVMNLDRLDANNQPFPDGVFDFIDNAATQGGLIQSQNGRIYFPVTEPFGSHLANKILDGLEEDTEQARFIISQVVYQELYDSTKTAAQQIPAKNRFKIKGQFQSASSSEISLNALNVPQGSVTVTAGGVRLRENIDYTVDYNLGRVRILNEGLLDSRTPIKVSLESNSFFNIQTKTLVGSRFDYMVNDHLNVGSTIMKLWERPLTQKVNMGDEPVNNTILGADVNYQNESEFLTRLVDAIPFIDTKAKSSVDFSAEAAYLIPGHSKAIGKNGNAYLDDFEGSQSTIDLRSISQWFLASTPKLQADLFPEGQLEDSLVYNYNRAKMSWYMIDPLFFRNDPGLTPPNVDEEMQSDHRMREVLEAEVFPNRQLPAGTPPNIATLNFSYYPKERGPNNYETFDGVSGFSQGLNADGSLVEPSSRWGGIQRSLNTTDFESANIEFIQFWVMDPFNDDSENISGGDLYFNLGNVSEDILNDSQLSYENGYPSENNNLPVLESNWGLYPDPSTFNVVNAFDNSTNNYSRQDIGIDGLNSEAERDFFADWLADLQGNLDQGAYNSYVKDPSADDFTYFRGPDLDDANLNILDRYKNYNGYEGNSNTSAPDGYPITSTTIPNTEDINQDITLNTIESYFQYKVSMRSADMETTDIGTNFISDVMETSVTTANGEQRAIKWYQFKIPVRQYSGRYGGITDYRSIRYMRMFMKGWSEPVTLRFARLELVRGEWRKFQGSLETPQESESDDPFSTTFNISAVNIEENGNREPINYVIPPGIIREIDVGTANQRSLNEQSMALSVCNLQDGDARGAYRNVNFDMRRYKRVQMFVHAEQARPEDPLDDNDVTCFIRLGTDFDDNYYEYEIPLKLTPWFTTDPELIWPEENNMDIELSKLQNLKTERPGTYSLLAEYVKMDGKARLKVKGNPNMANVVTIMVGVRNPYRGDNPWGPDDGLSKCAIIWANELRLTDFQENGGWAAVARMNAQLADFANVSLAGNISTPNWGTLEQRILERKQETIRGVDANSTVQLGKFFGENTGLTLPMYVGYGETVSTPLYDPLQPDIELSDVPNLDQAKKSKSQSVVRRRSINFTNVSFNPQKKEDADKPPKNPDKALKVEKEPKPDKPMFYDIKNFSLNYSYTEVFKKDINTDFNLNKNYKGGLNYNFGNTPKEITPFSNVGFVSKTKPLRFIKEFNFYTGLRSFSFSTGMNRTYEQSRVRNNSKELLGIETDMLISTQVMKKWDWNRIYNVNYDLTKSIKMSYNANNTAFVQEPRGVINKDDQDFYMAYRDTVWDRILSFGENTNFTQSASISYRLPLEYFPLVDFMSSDVKYTSNYSWSRAAFSQDSLGNVIQNSRVLSLNASANLLKLYNKLDYLKDINTPKPKSPQRKSRSNQDKDGYGEEKPEEEKGNPINPLEILLRLMMSVQDVSGTYQRNEGLLMPGYNRGSQFIGLDQLSPTAAPGLGFVFGEQNSNIWGKEVRDFAQTAADSDWLKQVPFQNQQFKETYSENWSLRANIEPIKDVKVELTANRMESRNYNSFFRWDPDTMVSGAFVHQSPMETGSFTASILTWNTAFKKDYANFSSDQFINFLSYREVTSKRLNDENYRLDTPVDGYYDGFGATAQDVVIPAFIAAYMGKGPEDVALNSFKTKVAPNWRLSYDGLTKISVFKKYFKRFSVNHKYASTMTSSYVTNLNYREDELGRPTARDNSESQNYITGRQINTVSISEQLAPMVGFNMVIKTAGKNDPSFKVEWNKDRNVSLGLSSYQITENRSNALVFGLGYKFTDVPNPFAQKKGSRLPIKTLKNTEMNLRIDLTIRDNVTIIRKMVENQNQVTAGQKLISIKSAVDLTVSQALTLRFFYDHQLTKPKISTSFPTSNINSGISLRFSLTQ